MDVLGRRALNRATLARQHLLDRSAMTPAAMVEHLVGMQSQAPHCAYYGLWSRLRDFDFAAASALLADRSVLRIALMRSTIHLVTAADALRLRPLVQPCIERGLLSNPTFKPGLADVDVDAVARLGRELMDERPRTPAELREAFAETYPDGDPTALTAAVRCLVPSVQVPPRGLWNTSGPIAHTTLPAWLGRDVDETASLDALVPRYLAAFGPASVKDMQKWCGLTRLRTVFERLRPGLRVFRDENGVELFDLPDAPRPDAATPAPARLVAPFDNVLLSHADRSRVIDAGDLARLISVNGIVHGALLVDGFFAGTWDVTRTRKAATVTLSPYEAIAAADRDVLEAEAYALLGATDPGLEHAVVTEKG